MRELKRYGITVDTPAGNWKTPAKPGASDDGQSEQYLYGVLKSAYMAYLFLRGVPEGVVDANKINERELAYFYSFDESGRQSLADKGLKFNDGGQLVKLK